LQLEDEDYRDLLNKYNRLFNDNEQKKKLGVHDYSLINALLKKTDEVNLHSNFIYSMINPKSSHYCGKIFLQFFLKVINEDGFIDIDNANVYKEKGKIDLLIEDGEHIIIIENKLKAKDQGYQISRYIQYVVNHYLQGNKEDLEEKIHVVYLSEYKSKPSAKSESIIGFRLETGKLKWNNIPIYDEGKIDLNLDKNTQLKFNRIQHSNQLAIWVKDAKKYLITKPNSKSLIYAFDEYDLILERLKNNRWRKIMSLAEYTLNKIDKNYEKKMFQFMREANKEFSIYMGKKLFREVDILISENERLSLEYKNEILASFTEKNCINWFNPKTSSKGKEIGFRFRKNNNEYSFAMGQIYIYVRKYEKDKCFDSNDKTRWSKEDDIFAFLENLKEYSSK